MVDKVNNLNESYNNVIVSRQQKKIFHNYKCYYVKNIKKKNKIQMSIDSALDRGYCPCKVCQGISGWIMWHPELKDQNDSDYLKISLSKDKKTMFIRTEMGFWKIYLNKKTFLFELWHLNQFKKNKPDSYLTGQKFHRQTDATPSQNLDSLLDYVEKHDKAKKIIQNDYKKLPNKTKREKYYYRCAKNREAERRGRRVDKLFKKLDRDRKKQMAIASKIEADRINAETKRKWSEQWNE